MRLGYLTAVLAALATTGAADRMTVNTQCPCDWCGACDSRDATFFTDFGAYGVNANKGCRKTNVPHMVEFCVDWDKGRAHFRYDKQDKRCLVMKSRVATSCSADHCHRSEWEPIACSW
ncbi:hypothetical protein C8A00DRAFT_13922 [Chaetomidium leptoderma]|uniref:Uncharacterized protein n=1 Tax=Chaetomidium leptoderma TaxID=669021 RepID=A0AAN6VRD0_9PEZI|nr:hypothetical protein C8A00DRAFT_13922 [Chaetomidium leptoderma]